MSSISSVGSSSTLDTQFAQQLVNQSGSSDGSMNENEFIKLLQNNPQLAQGLAGVEGGSSSTTIDQLYQKLSDGNGSISLSQLGTALGQLRSKMQSSESLPPPPLSDGGQPSAIDSSATDSSSASNVTGSTTVGQLVEDALASYGSNSSTASGISTSAGTSGGSTSDLTSVVALLEQMLKQMQTQGYSQDGTATSTGSVSFFTTTS